MPVAGESGAACRSSAVATVAAGSLCLARRQLGSARDQMAISTGPRWPMCCALLVSSAAEPVSDRMVSKGVVPSCQGPTYDASDAGLDAPAIQHDARALASEVTLAAGNSKLSFFLEI